jgi:hypothetical protein
MWKFFVALMLITTPALAVEIPLPDGVTEEQLKEWVAVLQERAANQTMEQNAVVKAEVEKAKTSIDTYRKSVGLAPKFEVAKLEPIEEVKPIEEPKDLPQG